jgi:hypothetical protein
MTTLSLVSNPRDETFVVRPSTHTPSPSLSLSTFLSLSLARSDTRLRHLWRHRGQENDRALRAEVGKLKTLVATIQKGGGWYTPRCRCLIVPLP